ncbi:haloacid dehalogenase-like hydrolase [Myxococcota bacterium]|nr:haloacid dehalogenase-like hydrolase [Myxococcota bacterium]
MKKNMSLIGVGTVFMAVFGASACTSPATPPASGLTQSADALRKLSVVPAGNRQISVLDINSDGKIGPEDISIFDEISKSAATALGDKSTAAKTPREGLYHAEKEIIADLFSGLTIVDSQLDLSKYDPKMLQALMLETSWMARQATLVSHFGTDVDRKGVLGASLRQKIPGYNADFMSAADLCLLSGKLDYSPWTRAGLVPTVVFDLDSTVWAGNVMDVFLAAVIDRKIAKPEANKYLQTYLKTLADTDAAAIDAADVNTNAQMLLDRWQDSSLPKAARAGGKETFESVIALLKGLDIKTVSDAAQQAFEKGANKMPSWNSQVFVDGECSMKKVITGLQTSGVKVYLLSATLNPLAIEAARQLGVPEEQALGSMLEIVDGLYTGQVKDSTYYTKGSIVRQWLPSPPVLAFGDSPSSDFSMLQEALGAAFMLNPRPKLIKFDKEKAGGLMVGVRFSSVLADESKEDKIKEDATKQAQTK